MMLQKAHRVFFFTGAFFQVFQLCAEDLSLKNYALGYYDEIHGKNEEALTRYQSAAKTNGSAFAPINKISNLQMQAGKTEEAMEIVSAYADSFPKNISAQQKAISLLEQIHKHPDYPTDEILKRLEKIEAVAPQRIGTSEKLLRVLNNAERYEEAQSIFEQKAGGKVEEASAEYWLFMLKQSSKIFITREESAPWEKAILEKLSTTDLENARVARRLSDFYRDEGRKEESVSVLRKHLEKNPQSLKLRTHLGILLMHYGQREEGHETLLKVLSINPRDVQAQTSMARYYKEEGEEDKALEHKSEALELRGGSAEEFTEIALEYMKRLNPRKARLLMEKAAYAYPEEVPVKAAMAMATFEEGYPEKAEGLFELVDLEKLEIKDLEPVSKITFGVTYASCLISLEKYEKGEVLLKSAIREAGKADPVLSSKALTLLAESWMARDVNHKAAKSLLQRALRLDGSNQKAKERLEALK